MGLDKIILELILLQKKRKNKSKNKINKLQKKKNKKNISKNRINKKNTIAPICSLTQSLINKAVYNVKKSKKEKNTEDKVIYKIKEENPIITNGGYGTISKTYGAAPVAKYVNYDKLFSHLGIFRAKGMYENAGEREADAKQIIESTREMVSTETIEKASKHFKYFVRGEVMGGIGYVPPVGLGINSKEWEKYRLMSMMSIYQPLIKLKSISA